MTKSEIAMEMIRHCDDLERLAVGTETDEIAEMEQTENDVYHLIFLLKSAIGNSSMTDYKIQKKLDDFQRELYNIRYYAAMKIAEDIKKLAEDESKNEGIFLLLFFGALSGGADLSRVTIADSARISKYGKYHGLTIQQIFRKLSQNDVNRIYETVAVGIQNYKPYEEIVESVKKVFSLTGRDIKAEVDTIINGVANDTAMEFAAKNNLRLKYMTALDDKVCRHCKQYQSVIFNANDPDLPNVPQHIFCRCRLVPIGGDDLTEKKFGDYFNSLTEAEKRTRIGNAKYEMYKRGELKISKFVEPPVQARLSIQDIAERDSMAFKNS